MQHHTIISQLTVLVTRRSEMRNTRDLQFGEPTSNFQFFAFHGRVVLACFVLCCNAHFSTSSLFPPGLKLRPFFSFFFSPIVRSTRTPLFSDGSNKRSRAQGGKMKSRLFVILRTNDDGLAPRPRSRPQQASRPRIIRLALSAHSKSKPNPTRGFSPIHRDTIRYSSLPQTKTPTPII